MIRLNCDICLGISGKKCDQCARGYKQYHPLTPVSFPQFQLKNYLLDKKK